MISWVLTDGKAGDEAQCLGVTEALGLSPEIRRIRPRAPFAWAMPWGPIDPREAPARPGSPVAPPFPDLLVASGRRAIPYVRAVKRATGGRVYTVVLKDPRTGTGGADLIWVPEHDKLRGPNVVATLTPPHRLSAQRLAAARAAPDPRLGGLPRPRAAILVGGGSRHHFFTGEDIEDFGDKLQALASSGVALMGTASRRTDPGLKSEVEIRFRAAGGFLWDGTGENPYVSLLALADAVVVTADSYNMVGEAAATGAPILIFEPSGGHPKFTAFLEGLKRHGAVKPFAGRLEPWTYDPLDSTPTIAAAVADGFARHRRALGLSPGLPESV